METYLERVLAGDQPGALAIAESALESGLPISRLYLDVFQASQRRVGELWATNAISVGMEHRATAITQTVIAALYDHVMADAGHGRLVLVACPGREIHELGARMVADFAEMAGYDVAYVGAVRSPQALVDEVRRVMPESVGLSATLLPHLGDVADYVRALRESFGDACPRIIVGGRAFSFDSDAWRKVDADCFASDAEHAVQCLDRGTCHVE
jgi:methanogenic corrinoid protein MtbC1